MNLQTDAADRESASLNAVAEKPSEPARATLLRIGFGFAAAQSLSVAAELGIADLLAAGPQTVEALAAATGTEPSALRRLMRLLAAEGIFAEEASGTFAQTPLSDALRADASGSPRDFLRMIGREPFLAWGRLLDAVRTGRPSFELVFGAPRFDWLAQNPEAAALFQAAMVALGGDVDRAHRHRLRVRRSRCCGRCGRRARPPAVGDPRPPSKCGRHSVRSARRHRGRRGRARRTTAALQAGGRRLFRVGTRGRETSIS